MIFVIGNVVVFSFRKHEAKKECHWILRVPLKNEHGLLEIDIWIERMWKDNEWRRLR